jgi:triosephosphate isomerase
MQNKKIIVCNWKSYGNKQIVEDFIKNLKFLDAAIEKNVENFIVALPHCYFYLTKNEKNVHFAAQNISVNENISQTGEITAQMLLDFNINYSVIGHSERTNFETIEDIIAKINNAANNNITPILCIKNAESLTKILDLKQGIFNHKIILAYEPAEFIGGNKDLNFEIIQQELTKIQAKLQNFPNLKLIYGGSVNEKNIEQLKNINCDGFMLGTASRSIDSLSKILNLL